MRDIGGADPQSAFLRAVVVGPAETSTLTVDLDRTLRDAGHDVTLLTGSPSVSAALDDGPRSGASRPGLAGSVTASSGSAHSGPAPSGPQWAAAGPAPRAVPLLAWSRLDTWARTGRRLRGVDVIVLIHSGARSVPALLALLHGVGGVGSDRDRRRPRMVLVAAAPLTSPGGRPAWNLGARLTAALVQRVDAVLVHDDATAAVATELGADRVRVTTRPVCRPEQPVGVTPGAMLGLSSRSFTGSETGSSTASTTGSSTGSSTGLSTVSADVSAAAGSSPPANPDVPGVVPSGGPLSGDDRGRTRVAMGAVAREVRHGLAIGSRLASGGFTTPIRRQGPSRRLDLERAQTERAQTERAQTERAPRAWTTPGRTMTEHAAAAASTDGADGADGTDGTDGHGSEPDTALSAEWAHYVGVLESLASPLTSGFPATGWSDGSDANAAGDVGDVGDEGDAVVGDPSQLVSQP